MVSPISNANYKSAVIALIVVIFLKNLIGVGVQVDQVVF